jgi:hypothetical protein
VPWCRGRCQLPGQRTDEREPGRRPGRRDRRLKILAADGIDEDVDAVRCGLGQLLGDWCRAPDYRRVIAEAGVICPGFHAEPVLPITRPGAQQPGDLPGHGAHRPGASGDEYHVTGPDLGAAGQYAP